MKFEYRLLKPLLGLLLALLLGLLGGLGLLRMLGLLLEMQKQKNRTHNSRK